MEIKDDIVVGLFDGFQDIVDVHLGIKNFRTRTAALQFFARKPFVLDGEGFVRAVFDRLDANWRAILPRVSKPPSMQNFRWHEPKSSIGDGNASPEVTLERALIRACINANRKDWSNQVPVISGIAGPHAYKKCAIDLIHREEDGGFELVELKVRSDTPLHATIEILQYGLLWLLSRRDQETLGYTSKPILDASTLQLSVLAPRRLYDQFQPNSFATELSTGLSALGKQFDVEMSFRQTAFPQSFEWPTAADDGQLLDWLDRGETV
jgi:hypothetical protein